jgi:hypothetical protein
MLTAALSQESSLWLPAHHINSDRETFFKNLKKVQPIGGFLCNQPLEENHLQEISQTRERCVV